MHWASSLAMFVAAGLAGGLLLGLIGVGMALVAVPLLTLFLPEFGVPAESAPLTAIATSMGIVAIGSVSSAISHHRLGNVDWRVVKLTVPFGLVGMAAGSLVAPHLPASALQWIFAGFLVFVAIGMWRQARAEHPSPLPSSPRYRVAGGTIGMAGSLIGAGGGIFMVPFLHRHGHDMASAVATSTVIGLPVSILGTLVYASQSNPGATPTTVGYIFLPALVGVSFGSILGAPLGARWASRVPAHALKRIFAVALLALAIKLVSEGA
ncbi:sulfite exporter TauE/SafE family protein [Stenotrophomonas sp.]|uniref:sulfite exporter TauE/SafE family protein n=1 Tax=Stenotrophomonas sp. TaxID=69392 RepID=UPI0028AAF799|nr:sulfite exporter TauE/SafE family protein [Stenotrophomonas sp.]